jgi:hypothetical protein
MSIADPQKVYDVIKYLILAGIVVGFGSLAITSSLVFDTYYITKNPKFFTAETLLFGTLTAIPIAYLSYMRGSTNYKKVFSDSFIFFIKVVLIHIGFQLSGIYSVLFPESAPPFIKT